MDLYDHLVVIIFSGLYPAYDFFYSIPKFKKYLSLNKPGIRKKEYQKSISWIWILSILVIIIWRYNDRDFVDLGLDFSLGWQIWLSSLIIVIALTYFIYLYRTIKRDAEQKFSLSAKMKNHEGSENLPHNKQEFGWFILVAISAGICEELLYRGFLIWYFNVFSSTAIAVVSSTILFGIAHLFQGWKGGLQASFAGLILAFIYLLTGSLWIPIALHIIGDLYSGLIGWLAFDETKILNKQEL